MGFLEFVMTFGVVGTSLLLGVMTRTLWLRDDVRVVGWWVGPLFFMGGVGAFLTSYYPVVEPLWVHYLLIVGLPFAVGYVGLALLIGRGSTDRDEEVVE